MSTDQETTNDVPVEDNLDDFAADFFGEKQEPSDNAKSEDEGVESETVDDAPEEDQEDTHSDDEAAEDDEEVLEEERTPKKSTRYQERINEITAERRAAERRAEEAERELAELKTRTTPSPKGSDKGATPDTVGAPLPNDVNEDGTDKYPLGEFDPKYLRDTVQHLLKEERAKNEEVAKEEARRNEVDTAKAELQTQWNNKLVDARERYPDFQDKGEEMLQVFEGIDAAYGEYLTDTIMDMDAGPDVFYYLANNVEEAQEIVNAGPRKATIALAKLEAQLAGTPVNKVSRNKVTNAPTPPPRVKGSSVSRPGVAVDTDDLDAFSKDFFKKKK